MRSFFLFMLVAIATLTISAQPLQKGIVKTKGRMLNGKLVPGKAISQAKIVLGDNSNLLSDTLNGFFSFFVRGNNYSIKDVKKSGYQLVDPQVCRQYNYSTNLLYLVMETPSQQMEDRLKAENSIRETLQRKLKQREDELEKLKAQNKLTQEEYQKACLQLYNDNKNNEKLIADMAKEYSQIDYDQLDDLNRQISDAILNGELFRADSLLRSKGDINARIAEILRAQQVEAQREAEIAIEQGSLDASKEGTKKKLDDIAQDCFYRFELHNTQHHNDSAIYYIKLRARLDSTNIKWQCDVGDFISKHIAAYEDAISFYNIALSHAKKGSLEEVECLINIGDVYQSKFETQKAVDYYNQALTISTSTYGKESLSTAKCYDHLSFALGNGNYFEKALEYAKLALSIYVKLLGNKSPEVASSYNHIGSLYNGQIFNRQRNNYKPALHYHKKALSIRESIWGHNNFDVAVSYHNIGMVYNNKKDYIRSLDYLKKSLGIRLSVYGDEHPSLINSYISIGQIYYFMKDYNEANRFYKKALNIGLAIYGEIHPSVARCYSEIGMVFSDEKNYPEAIINIKKSLEINTLIYRDDNEEVGVDYYNLGFTYFDNNDYINSIDMFEKAVIIFEKIPKMLNYITNAKQMIVLAKSKIEVK